MARLGDVYHWAAGVAYRATDRGLVVRHRDGTETVDSVAVVVMDGVHVDRVMPHAAEAAEHIARRAVPRGGGTREGAIEAARAMLQRCYPAGAVSEDAVIAAIDRELADRRADPGQQRPQ